MGDYRLESIPFSDLERAIRMPTYQRPLVWSKNQKLKFIENLSKGYPFGSLLLYKYPDDMDKYTLIDGQQRYTTIREYASKPEEYFPIESSPYIEELMEITGAARQNDSAKAKLKAAFTKIVRDYIQARSASNDVDLYYLYDAIADVFPLIKDSNEIMRAVSNLQKDIANDADAYVDLGTLILPCVIFTGNPSELPEVFANVNLGGRKLTKYQVFSAQWNRYIIDLGQGPLSDSILEKTIDRYNDLTVERQGIEIEDFSEAEMRNNRQITLPEFCHALGESIIERCPACWPRKQRDLDDDAIDTLGYNTVAIVFGTKPQAINLLADQFDNSFLDNNPQAVEQTLGYILDEYEMINNLFSRYLRKPGVAKETYETSKTTGQLQFLSFFATLWRLHYTRVGASNGFVPIEKYRTRGYKDACDNLFGCFLIDMLTNQWKGSGDSRLGSYVEGARTYTTAFSIDELESALFNWIKQESDEASINLDPVAKTLLTVYSSGRKDQYGELSYDIEHILSRDVLRTKVDGTPCYKQFSIPGGGLGNILYLPSSLNRAKGSTSLALYAPEEYRLEGDRHLLPSPKVISRAENCLREGNPEPAKKMMNDRAKLIADAIVQMFR